MFHSCGARQSAIILVKSIIISAAVFSGGETWNGGGRCTCVCVRVTNNPLEGTIFPLWCKNREGICSFKPLLAILWLSFPFFFGYYGGIYIRCPHREGERVHCRGDKRNKWSWVVTGTRQERVKRSQNFVEITCPHPPIKQRLTSSKTQRQSLLSCNVVDRILRKRSFLEWKLLFINIWGWDFSGFLLWPLTWPCHFSCQ